MILRWFGNVSKANRIDDDVISYSCSTLGQKRQKRDTTSCGTIVDNNLVVRTIASQSSFSG